MYKGKGLFSLGRRVLALALAATMTFSLAACGGEDAQQGDQEPVREWVYVPEFLTIENEDVPYYNMQFAGDRFYFISRSWDEETQESKEELGSYSLTDKKVSTVPIAWPEEGELENRGVNRFVVAEDGSLYAAVYTYGGEEGEESKQYLCKFDSQGNWIFTADMTKDFQDAENDFYVQDMAVDSQGRVYVNGSGPDVRLYDGEGNYEGTVSVGSGEIWIQGMFSAWGSIYVSFNTYGNGSSTKLVEIDFDGKKTGASYDAFPNSARSAMPGDEGIFLINDGNGISEYSLEKQEKTKLFDWLDCDINGNYVESFGVMEDGRIAAVIQDWEMNDNGIALLTKKKASEVPQKEIITVGTLSGGYNLRSLAVKFNKTNEKYHVSIKEYLDYDSFDENSYSNAITNMNNEITSGNSPDIIDLSSVNVAQLASKGVFEDLNGFLDKSSVLSRSDFFENILVAYTYDDKLVGIPASFSIVTLMGHKSKLGDKKGWTLEEMIAYADANPEADLFDRVSKREILQGLMMMNADEFVDWSEGVCKFDTDEFKKLLQFVNRYPDEVDWDADAPVTPIRIQNGEVLLYTENIYDFRTIQEGLNIFGGDAVCIGYPTVDGSSGHAFTGAYAYAIMSKSDSKDGAWAFIESILIGEEDNNRSNGFPAIRSKLEAKAADAVEVKYVKDENGEVYLDENGEPIIEGAGGGIGWGDWFYEYHLPTQEEVDIVMGLIEEMKPLSYNNNDEIMTIVLEEAEPFFKGQKSVDEVTGIIQNRVNIYINENR